MWSMDFGKISMVLSIILNYLKNRRFIPEEFTRIALVFFLLKNALLNSPDDEKTIKFTKKHQIFKWMPLRNSQSHSTLDCFFTIYTIKRFYFCSSFIGLDLVSITIHSNKLAKYCNIRSSVEIFRTRYPGDSHALRWEKWWKYLFTTLITTEYKNLLCDYKFVLLGCI